MGISINFPSKVEITHINLRKQGPEDCRDLAVDLKIEGLAANGEAIIMALFGCDQEMAGAFWRPSDVSDDLSPSMTGLTEMQSWAEFDGKHTLNIAGLSFRPAMLKKFKVKPVGGGAVNVVFQASITDVENRHLNILTEMLQELTPCEVLADPDMFDGEEG